MAEKNGLFEHLVVHEALVAPHAFPGAGNGFLATGTVEKDSLLVAIPRDLLFSTHTTMSIPSLRRVVEASFKAPISGSALSAMEVLALGLLYCKFRPQTSAFWTTYISGMPKSYDSLIFWSEDMLELLGAPELVERVTKRKLKIISLYEHMMETVRCYYDEKGPEEEEWLRKISVDEFRWAYASIMSRSVFVEDAALWSGDLKLRKDNAALPPLLDYFNHSNDTEVSAKYDSKACRYELWTKQSWKEGEQVFIKYGAHSNATLLTHYGFAIEENAHDSIRLDLEFVDLIESMGGDFQDAKISKLLQMNLISPKQGPNGRSIKIKHELSVDGLGWNTMVAIKTMLIDSEKEMLQWDRLLEDEPISPSNEAKYKDYCANLYFRMVTQLDEADKKASKFETENRETGATNTDTWFQLASTFRKGRRTILNAAIEALDAS